MVRNGALAVLFSSVFCAATVLGEGALSHATTPGNPPPSGATEAETCLPSFTSPASPRSVNRTGGGVQITVPKRESDGLLIANAVGTQVKIGFPDAARAGLATNRGCTAAEYTYANWKLVVVGPDNLGLVGIGVVIQQPTATERYTFTIGAPAGARIEARADGSVAVIDRLGAVICVLVTPDAVTADRLKLPVRYEVEGAAVTLVVSHQSATPPPSYPIAVGNIYAPGSLAVE